MGSSVTSTGFSYTWLKNTLKLRSVQCDSVEHLGNKAGLPLKFSQNSFQKDHIILTLIQKFSKHCLSSGSFIASSVRDGAVQSYKKHLKLKMGASRISKEIGYEVHIFISCRKVALCECIKLVIQEKQISRCEYFFILKLFSKTCFKDFLISLSQWDHSFHSCFLFQLYFPPVPQREKTCAGPVY